MVKFTKGIQSKSTILTEYTRKLIADYPLLNAENEQNIVFLYMF